MKCEWCGYPLKFKHRQAGEGKKCVGNQLQCVNCGNFMPSDLKSYEKKIGWKQKRRKDLLRKLR